MMTSRASYTESPTETDQSLRGIYYLKNYTKDFNETTATNYCIVGAKGLYFSKEKKSVTIELILPSDLDGVKYTTLVLVDGTRMSFHYNGGGTWTIQVLRKDDEIVR